MTLKAHAHDNARRSQNVVDQKIRSSFSFEKRGGNSLLRCFTTLDVLVNDHHLGTVQMYPTLERTVQDLLIYASRSPRAFTSNQIENRESFYLQYDNQPKLRI